MIRLDGWTWDPLAGPLLTFSACVYAAGLLRLWNRAGADHGIRNWEVRAFALGWLALLVALLSPLDTLGAALFSAHMAQHEVLMLVAAPLIVLGRPLLVFFWSLPPAAREAVGRSIRRPWVNAGWRGATGPFVVWVLHALALWVWHVPALYQAALTSEPVHWLQHASFFGSAALFWWVLIHGRYGRLGYGLAALYVFTTSVHSGVLGALLTFAPTLWYPLYAGRTSAWQGGTGSGLSPLEDQQLAGLLMWVPAGAILVCLGLALFAAWLGESERRVSLTRTETLLRAMEAKE